MASLSAGNAAERNLYRLAVAACGGQNRASATGLSEALAHGASEDPQAGEVRDLLLASHGSLPRHPHAEVYGQAASDLGHGGSDEQGVARSTRRWLSVHPDRRTHVPLHGQSIWQGS